MQRLKGAFDSLEEQARQRPTQPSPSRQSGASRRAVNQTNSPSRRRQRQNTENAKPWDLSGPDPDPSAFDPDAENVVDDTSNKPGTSANASDSSKTLGRRDESSEKQESEKEEKPDGTAEEADATPAEPLELPDDVKAKLRRLNKLEEKYQKLLEAYRRAHARTAAIEPFEAKLRESTPFTTINEPGALVEYLSQLSTRGDMAIDEFKKVSGQRDDYRRKLEEAQQRAREAIDEAAQLRQSQEPAAMDPSQEQRDQADDTASPGAASRSLKISQKVSGAEDMFSIDEELPRLQADLAEREGQIQQLESKNAKLKKELGTTQESAEHMVRDLEAKGIELESLRAASQGDQDRSEKEKALSQHLQNDIARVKSDLDAAEKQINEMKAKSEQQQELKAELYRRIHVMESESDQKAQTPAPPVTEDKSTPGHSGPSSKTSRNKKNKKKKKGGATDTSTIQKPAPTTEGSESGETVNKASRADDTSLQARLDGCVKELEAKSAEIDRLNSKLRANEEALEEIEHLRDQLLEVGSDHVDAKERVKSLESEKGSLEESNAKLERDLSQLGDRKHNESSAAEGEKATFETDLTQLRTEYESLQSERNMLEEKLQGLEGIVEESRKGRASEEAAVQIEKTNQTNELSNVKARAESLEMELSASQQLAASRFKEISTLQNTLQKSRTDLLGMRSEVSELKSTRDELTTVSAKVRRLESVEGSLRKEVETAKRNFADKSKEVNSLQEQVSQEKSKRATAEESNHKLEKDLQRTQTEKNKALEANESATKKLDDTEKQRESAQTKAQELQTQIDTVNRDAQGLREEIELKTKQYASAQSLMSSLRDQATEMATQLRETKERAESLEEELTDAHRLMNERGREGETMRRILSDIEGRADARVKEMRERMEVAIQERDQAEEEASTIGRRRKRELDDLKSRLSEAERDVRRAREERTDLERLEQQLRQDKTANERRAEQAAQEAAEARKAMSELRDALDEGEKQSQELDSEKQAAQRLLEDVQARLDKLQKTHKTLSDELRSVRAAKSKTTDSEGHSSRSSVDSSAPGRVASPQSVGRNSPKPSSGNTGNVDFVYLKNVLLQFLEQKDRKYQMQLVPVLGMLLHFDKKDEQRWMSAINTQQ
ncbi:MAG: hypothetical protein M1831_007322 [Alyxoria varia]|nr:MAG: hypothetical protein M1831_007322 [Alyxoria varia]